MNKSLFETRQKSIAHYTQQIKDLTATIKEIESVRDEVTNSLVEFFPFEMGDIIIKGETIIMVKTVDRVRSSHVDIFYKVPNGRGAWESEKYSKSIYFEELKDWKKIN